VLVVPERRVAVFAAVNWDYSFHNPENVARQVAGLLLAKAPGAPAPSRPTVTVAPAVLDAYVGSWRFEPGLVADAERDPTTRFIFEEILEQEEDHHDFFTSLKEKARKK
jgi:hypothetical protein